MRTSPLSLGIALVLAIPLGCTETPAPVAPTPTSTVAVAQNGPPSSADLSPVAEPADIVGVLRWKSPGATLAGVTATVPANSSSDGYARRIDVRSYTTGVSEIVVTVTSPRGTRFTLHRLKRGAP